MASVQILPQAIVVCRIHRLHPLLWRPGKLGRRCRLLSVHLSGAPSSLDAPQLFVLRSFKVHEGWKNTTANPSKPFICSCHFILLSLFLSLSLSMSVCVCVHRLIYDAYIKNSYGSLMMDILENTHCWFKLELSRLFLYRPDTNFGIREPRSLGCTDPTLCCSAKAARRPVN